MLKLLRNICIWMCSTSCLFGYVTHAVPMEYFDDHEFSYDMDTAQSEVKYDPRLLSQQLNNHRNHEQERAAPCYSATNKYTHGQRVAREDPCEVCLCVDGEIFCWWKKCGNIKRRKFKSEKSAKLGKLQRKAKTNEKIHKDHQQQQQQLQQLHLKQKKKIDLKLKQQHQQQQQQQHWQEQHNHHQQQFQRHHQAVRNKILTFPENLPSVLYYDYKTEDQHQHEHAVHHRNHEKLTASSSFMPTTTSTMTKTGGGGGVGSLFSVIGFAGAKITSSNSKDEHFGVDDDNNDEDDDDDDDTSLSAVGVAEPISTEVKSQSMGADESEAGIVKNSGQYTTVRIAATSTTTGTTAKSAPSLAVARSTTEPFLNEHPKEDQSNTEIQYISGHPAGDIGQMLNKNMLGTRHPTSELVNHNHTTTMASQSQEVDHDGILRDGPNDASHPLYHHPSPLFTEDSIGSSKSIKQNNEQQRGGVAGVPTTSFRSSFNDFSSEFNASAAMDLALIISHHSAHNAPIILEADSIANASLSSLPKHELGGPNAQSTTNSNNLVLNSTTTIIVVTATPAAAAAPSTTVNPAQECIVMGASYKIGAILPQDTGNCLQCVCIEGTTADDTPRVTCSPHNCPPLVLPDLFDATGY